MKIKKRVEELEKLVGDLRNSLRDTKHDLRKIKWRLENSPKFKHWDSVNTSKGVGIVIGTPEMDDLYSDDPYRLVVYHWYYNVAFEDKVEKIAEQDINKNTDEKSQDSST